MAKFISKYFLHKGSDNHELKIVNIRKNKINDLCPVYIKYRESANVTSSLSEIKKYLNAELSTPYNYILAAYKDGKIVGFMHYYRELSTLRPADRIVIKAMFVDKEYREQGIAKKLIYYIQEHLTVTEIRVKARLTNNASPSLYLNSGFCKDTEYMHLVYRRQNQR